jgi:hypothetical protein
MKYIRHLAAATAYALASVAHANLTLTLNDPNSALSGYPGPYGTVDIALVNSTQATLTFTAGSAGGYTYKFGDGFSVDFNINATVYGYTPSPVLTATNSNNVSSFGVFNSTFSNPDPSASGAVSSVTFSLTNFSGTWATASDVLTANDKGYLVAAHVFVFNAAGGNPLTGFAGNGGGGSSVPDAGTTTGLLGVGLLAVALLRRRFAA